VEIRPGRCTDFQEGQFWVDDVFIIPSDYFPPVTANQKQDDFIDYLNRKETKNLIKDYSFDKEEFLWEGEKPAVRDGHLGQSSYHLSKDEVEAPGFKWLSQQVTVRANVPYLFGAFVRTEVLASGLFSDVECQGIHFRTKRLEGDHDWTILMGVFRSSPPPEGRKEEEISVRFWPARLNNFVSGEFWLDNVFMVPLTDIPREIFLRPAEKIFLYLHFMDPHIPYNPPETYLRHFKRKESFCFDQSSPPGKRDNVDEDRYNAEIRALDDQLGLLFEDLDRRGILDETLVIITADHGEGFGEHGIWGHKPRLVYDEGNRVPLILYAPGLFTRPERREETVEASVGALPTLVDLLELEVPDEAKFQGKSYFCEDGPCPRNAYYYEDPCARMVTNNIWKYVSNEYYSFIKETEIWGQYVGVRGIRITVRTPHDESEVVCATTKELLASGFMKNYGPVVREEISKVFKATPTEKALLFNIRDDPGEKQNVVDRYPGKVQELKRLLHKQIAVDREFQETVVSGGKAKISGEMRKNLRALGYL